MQFDFLEKIRRNIDFRIKFFLKLSLIFNTTYACFLFIIGHIYSSYWFIVMSIYYALLSSSRLYIFRKIVNKKKIKSTFSNAKTLLHCGCFLLIINVIVSIAMFILFRKASKGYHLIIVITIATYTFTTLTIAIINSAKFIKNNNFTYLSLKLITLVAASVSLVTLTNTMLTSIGTDNEVLRSILLPILSAVVALFIVGIAIVMIINANKILRTYKNEEKQQ